MVKSFEKSKTEEIMSRKNGKGKKLYYLYYWSGGKWHLLVPGAEKAGQERLADLFLHAAMAMTCRKAEKIMQVSLTASKKAPEKLPEQIGENPCRRDFKGTGMWMHSVKEPC